VIQTGEGVYFLQAQDSGAIKIGSSKCITTRAYEIQTSNHEQLTILGVIDVVGSPRGRLERSLHRQFEGARIRNEWFRPTPELLQLIAERASTFWAGPSR
jgi:hypothetical protein